MNQTANKISVQIPRFIVVGSFAAGVHIVSLFVLVSLCHWQPLIANVLAFSFAFVASFSGHHYWTFNTTLTPPTQALWKFFLIALLSFGLNQSLFYLFLVKYHFYYLTALIMVLLVVPPLTFLLSKGWAFRAREISCE